ncbi:CBS domain-containing protein [Shewanella sp. D64]|uniref:CBS domain-containing protein n=1 Tax=unclassified Shewanella TaxID=196818 RepID=UPI0022BA4C18|nr:MULTISPECIES: CBS domain-containing protein [unclassified Shewanella]MEC4725181.1 CBS domain-containing protein [Shewanella sp. D64]MEC4737082.1 CBS domain-containing protein [Shewanella sp. E94]WBJ96667.1 CBS domain-containing protein [Shewanella sp. MTB7]
MKVSNIMSTQLVCISHEASLKDAHDLMKNRGVRHLPVISESNGTLVGILTHKKMISTVMSIIYKYGADALEKKERHQGIQTLMESDFQRLNKDEPLTIVAEYFIDNKLGCLPVVDAKGKIEGIVTSSDFVKLCAELLKSQ